MNCAVRSVVRYGISVGLSVFGVTRGFQGLINKNFKLFESSNVSNIISRGGTVLKTARSQKFRTQEGRKQAFENLRSEDIDSLVVVGGNGSFQGASIFHREFDFPVIGIPATIDNDIQGTQKTLGFDTALNTAMDAIDKIKDTASSMDRIFLIEVMGRHSGAIAVYSAIAGGAEDIIIPEAVQDLEAVIAKIRKGQKNTKRSWIIIVAEGTGETEKLARRLEGIVEEVRVSVIGHIQRGGSPSAFDRFLGALLGKAAVDALLQGKTHHAVGWENDKTLVYSLDRALEPKKEDFSELFDLVQILS